jgi:hypothetical protein
VIPSRKSTRKLPRRGGRSRKEGRIRRKKYYTSIQGS